MVIQSVFRNKYFPFLFQTITFIFFILLIVIGIQANTADLNFAKILRNTNLANLIVWSYWWPLIIIFSVLIGRIWCTVCPIEPVTSLFSRIGFKKKRPAFFKSGWIITIFYIIILFLGVHTLSIHRIPFRMALYLVFLFTTAIIIGLIFEKNTFCASVCPVGHLLGLYARLAPFGWRVKDNAVCSDCKDKSCISKKNLYRFQAKSCGVWLVPQHLDVNTECILCGQCLKACDRFNPGIKSRPNPALFSRKFAKDLLSLKPLSSAQSLFLLIVSGFVIYEIYAEWPVAKNILLVPSNFVLNTLGITGVWSKGIVESITIFLILPFLIWAIPYLLSQFGKNQLSFTIYLKIFGIAFIPIMASAHIIKAILKTASRVPYWRYTLSDPIGILTAQEITRNTISLSKNPSFFSIFITFISLVLLIAGFWLSVKLIARIINTHTEILRLKAVFYLIPILYGGIFIVMVVIWRVTIA